MIKNKAAIGFHWEDHLMNVLRKLYGISNIIYQNRKKIRLAGGIQKIYMEWKKFDFDILVDTWQHFCR